MEQTNVDLSQYIPVEEFVRRSGYHTATVYRWIEAELLQSISLYHRRLIPLAELERIQVQGSPKRARKK